MYTTDCRIQPIQNKQIDRAEVAKCILSVKSSTDLDYCVVFDYQVGVFLEHVHTTLKDSKRFTPEFPVVFLYFAGVFWLSSQAPKPLQHSLKT